MIERDKAHEREKQLKEWERFEKLRENEAINKDRIEHKKHGKTVHFDPVVRFLNACIDYDERDIEELLASGVDVNCADSDNLTGLHQACINNNIDLVKYLLDKKANINVCDNEHWTPLHVSCQVGDYELTKLLLSRGARLDIPNVDDDLPIHLISRENVELKRLVEGEMKRQNIKVDDCINYERNLLLKDIKQWKKVGMYSPPSDPINKSTPLHVAASKNYIDVMQNLIPLLSKQEINAQDIDGWTPLHAAAHWGHYDTCSFLIRSGADSEMVTYANESIYDLTDKDERDKFKENLKKVIAEVENKKSETPYTPVLRLEANSRRRSSIMRQSVELKKSVQQKEVINEYEFLRDHSSKKDDLKQVESKASQSDDNTAEVIMPNLPSIQEGTERSSGSLSTPELTVSAQLPEQTNNDEISSQFDGTIIKDMRSKYLNKETKLETSQEIIDKSQFETATIACPQIDISDDNSVSEKNVSKSPFSPAGDDNRDFQVVLRPQSHKDSIMRNRSVLSRTSIMSPAKSEEAEVSRRDTARKVRSTRRSTQGIASSEIRNLEDRKMKEVEITGYINNIADMVDGCSKLPLLTEEVNVDKHRQVTVNSNASCDPVVPIRTNERNPVVHNSDLSQKIVRSTTTHSSTDDTKSSNQNSKNFIHANTVSTISGSSLCNKPVVANVNPMVVNNSLSTLDKSKQMFAPARSTRYNSPLTNTSTKSDISDTLKDTNITLQQSDVSGSYTARHIVAGKAGDEIKVYKKGDELDSESFGPTKSFSKASTDLIEFSQYQPCPEINNKSLPAVISERLVQDEAKKKELAEQVTKLQQENDELKDKYEKLLNRNTVNVQSDSQYTNLLMELEKYKEENKSLRCQKEALLRVINKIQEELESLHTTYGNTSVPVNKS